MTNRETRRGRYKNAETGKTGIIKFHNLAPGEDEIALENFLHFKGLIKGRLRSNGNWNSKAY
ncbi:MAG: hypothetical protein J7L19_00710 [Dehalococcoidia bacterium]|nr:hypothetical protein [Dehalococcoidia bacterium]